MRGVVFEDAKIVAREIVYKLPVRVADGDGKHHFRGVDLNDIVGVQFLLGLFLERGNGGGGPISSSAVRGFGDGFGWAARCGVVRFFCASTTCRSTNNRTATMNRNSLLITN